MAVSTNFDARDPETGLLVKHQTEKQRQHWLLRNPQMVGKLAPVRDPNAMPACGTTYACRWTAPRRGSGGIAARPSADAQGANQTRTSSTSRQRSCAGCCIP